MHALYKQAPGYMCWRTQARLNDATRLPSLPLVPVLQMYLVLLGLGHAPS